MTLGARGWPAKAGAKATGPSGGTYAPGPDGSSNACPGSPAAIELSEDGGANLVFLAVGRGPRSECRQGGRMTNDEQARIQVTPYQL